MHLFKFLLLAVMLNTINASAISFSQPQSLTSTGSTASSSSSTIKWAVSTRTWTHTLPTPTAVRNLWHSAPLGLTTVTRTTTVSIPFATNFPPSPSSTQSAQPSSVSTSGNAGGNQGDDDDSLPFASILGGPPTGAATPKLPSGLLLKLFVPLVVLVLAGF